MALIGMLDSISGVASTWCGEHLHTTGFYGRPNNPRQSENPGNLVRQNDLTWNLLVLNTNSKFLFP